MSEIKDRLKVLRKHLGMTQQEFADRIGIKQNTYSQYETGRNAPIDSVFTLICREFGVSEDWLRNGSGEMLRQETEEGRYLKALLDDALADRDEKFRLALLEIILRLDVQQLRTVSEYAEKYLLPAMESESEHTSREGSGQPGEGSGRSEGSGSPPDADAGSLRQDGQSAGERTGEPTIEEKVEAYRQALLEEEALKGAGKVG